MNTINILKDYIMTFGKIYGEMFLHSEQCIGGDEPHIIATLCIDDKIQKNEI